MVWTSFFFLVINTKLLLYYYIVILLVKILILVSTLKSHRLPTPAINPLMCYQHKCHVCTCSCKHKVVCLDSMFYILVGMCVQCKRLATNITNKRTNKKIFLLLLKKNVRYTIFIKKKSFISDRLRCMMNLCTTLQIIWVWLYVFIVHIPYFWYLALLGINSPELSDTNMYNAIIRLKKCQPPVWKFYVDTLYTI